MRMEDYLNIYQRHFFHFIFKITYHYSYQWKTVIHTFFLCNSCMVALRSPSQHPLPSPQFCRTSRNLGAFTYLREKIFMLRHSITNKSSRAGNSKVCLPEWKLVRLSNFSSDNHFNLLKAISSSATFPSFDIISVINLHSSILNFMRCTKLLAVDEDNRCFKHLQYHTSKVVRFPKDADDGTRFTKLSHHHTSKISRFSTTESSLQSCFHKCIRSESSQSFKHLIWSVPACFSASLYENISLYELHLSSSVSKLLNLWRKQMGKFSALSLTTSRILRFWKRRFGNRPWHIIVMSFPLNFSSSRWELTWKNGTKAD